MNLNNLSTFISDSDFNEGLDEIIQELQDKYDSIQIHAMNSFSECVQQGEKEMLLEVIKYLIKCGYHELEEKHFVWLEKET